MKIALPILSIILVLALTEGVLRFFSPLQLGFEYVEGEFRRPLEFKYQTAGNRMGFHDFDHGPKMRDVTRVILLGDSYVAARTVPIRATVVQRLEHYLKSKSNRTYEVISCGEDRWGQREELEALSRIGPRLEPDFVVTLFLPFNDVRDNSTELRARAWRELTEMSHFRPGWTRLKSDEVPFFLVRSSVLNQIISFRLARVLATHESDQIPIDYYVYAIDMDETWQQAWKQTEELLLQTRTLAHKLGARYALVSASTPHGVLGTEKGLKQLIAVYPAMREREWDLDMPNKRLNSFCQNHQIPFLSLEPAFRQETLQGGRQLHWKYDGHWNFEGNDLAGELIADFILSLNKDD
ncbi:MAG: hypothetical protein ACE5OP_06740 [Candidatus Glassbacteria bacterium]